MENQDNKLIFIDEEGNEVLCEILFTFHSDEFNKDYVLFYPVGEEDEDGNIRVMAASYKEEENGNCGSLEEVVTDEEWELLEEVLETFAENQDDECECDDCDCEECDCEECECEEDEKHEHCCCCHHEEEK